MNIEPFSSRSAWIGRVLLATLASAAHAAEPFQQTGLGGGSIAHIVRVENGDVYIIAGGLVHRSTDLGDSWSATAPVPGASTLLGAGPGNRLYALGGALFVSEDDGLTWTQLANAPNPCRALVADAQGRLFAGSTTGLYRSIDSGATWTNLVAVSIGPLAAAPDTTVWYGSGKTLGHLDASGAALPGTVIESGQFSAGITALAARAGGGVYAGCGPNPLPVPDGGGVWRVDPNLSKAMIGLTAQYLTAIVARPNDAVFVCSRGFCFEGCVYGGVFGGTSTGGFTRNTPNMAAMGIVDEGSVLLAATSGIDGTHANPEFGDIAVPPAGVLVSDDGAATWEPRNLGLPYARVYTIASSPTQEVFVNADWWLFRTADRGMSWELVTPPPITSGMYQLFAVPDALYAARGQGVWSMSPIGSAWTPHSLPGQASTFAMTANGTLLALEAWEPDLFRSVDGGVSWTLLANVFPYNQKGFPASGRHGRMAMAMFAPGGAPATFLSEDDGLTWSQIANVAGPLAFDADESRLYVITGGNVLMLEESSNWASSPTPALANPTALAGDASGAIYAVSPASGVWHWRPGDSAWLSLGPNPPGAFTGRAFWQPRLLAADDGYVYLSTYNASVWRSWSDAATAVPDVAQSGFAFRGPFPNPFRLQTTLAFDLGRAEEAQLTLFDVRGRRIAALLDGAVLPAGPHTIVWHPGRDMARGVYLYELRIGPLSRSGRMVLR